jgi:hypothetical protein
VPQTLYTAMKRAMIASDMHSVLLSLPLIFTQQSGGITQIPDSAQQAKTEVKRQVTADDVIANYRKKVTITRPRCPERTNSDEIIVCAQDDSEFRVPPATTGRLATGGPPPAPDVAGGGIFKGPATFVRPPDRIFHCTTQDHDPPCAYEPNYLIDFSTLPEFDAEYAAQARAAAAEERRRQADQETNPDVPE